MQLRDYQLELARRASRSSTLLVLPTGLGKTVVAAMVIAEVLHKKGGKVLFLAPTRPLVEQHQRTLESMIEGKRIAMMTGEVDPVERELLFLENDIIASTPQVVANDLKHGRIDLKDVRLIIFDEAHRAVGNYAYVFVAKEYMEFDGL
ncbi:MAG: DEAD/DEAH box helicase, partial [Methanomassiliicoccales archaeon]|nr:DEAD/DEAH box helicase [Methanomassiliicoccales archaeon]